MLRKNIIISAFAIVLASCDAVGTSDGYLDAKQSDPTTLQWMVGTPPPQDKLISHPQSDYFSFPKLRWTVCHIRELLPTKQVSRGLAAAHPLDLQLDMKAIDSVSFTPLDRTQTMTWRESVEVNYSDGILILHKGVIVYEYYSGCLDRMGQHAAMSMTKSLTGLLAEILVAQGRLDENAKVVSIIPELASSAYADATVRQVMDMTTAVDFSENYADPNADIWQYSAAASPLPKGEDYDGPVGYFDYLKTVKKKGEHGKVFGYKTINTDALGWLVARTAGQDLAQFLSQTLWQKIGAEQDAYMTIDSKGTPFAGGGLSASLRDMARIGQLMLNGGSWQGETVFPSSVVDSIQQGGDKAAFEPSGYKALKGGSYRSMWWVFHNKHQAYAARGVHGQTVYVDPTADMVIVRFASYPEAKNSAIDPTSLPAYQAIAEYLLSKSKD